MHPRRQVDEEEMGSNPADLFSWPGGVTPPEFERFRRTKAQDAEIDREVAAIREWQRTRKEHLRRHLAEPDNHTRLTAASVTPSTRPTTTGRQARN
jgi:hypothetical protein